MHPSAQCYVLYVCNNSSSLMLLTLWIILMHFFLITDIPHEFVLFICSELLFFKHHKQSKTVTVKTN